MWNPVKRITGEWNKVSGGREKVNVRSLGKVILKSVRLRTGCSTNWTSPSTLSCFSQTCQALFCLRAFVLFWNILLPAIYAVQSFLVSVKCLWKSSLRVCSKLVAICTHSWAILVFPYSVQVQQGHIICYGIRSSARP